MVAVAQPALPLRSLRNHRPSSSPTSPISSTSSTFFSTVAQAAPPVLVGMSSSANTAGRQLNAPTVSTNFVIPKKQTSYRLNAAFFLFGLLNNSLYVVILTAALELLPRGVPTGLVSFANIFPALIAKAVWPYMLRGRVRYTKRVGSCALLSFVGMLLVSFFPSLLIRLLGISLASFSSGLGELTFLQLSTRYAPKISDPSGFGTNFAGDGVGWFASGTGAAGLVGAGAWWIVKPLGVQKGMAILSILPGFMLLSYLVVLPSVFDLLGNATRGQYEPLPATDDAPEEDEDVTEEEHIDEAINEQGEHTVRLSFQEKMTLLRPMLLPFILPLVTVYFAEYTINQGVAPTLLYPLPTSSAHPLLALMIKKLSDYYPLYQLVYQTFVFLSRSSISVFRLPAIPKEYLWVPAALQTALLGLLVSESLHSWFRTSIASPLVIVLICIEGLAGGAAYVSVFYSIGTTAQPLSSIALTDEASDASHTSKQHEMARRAQEHEFRIGCVGFGDSLGILAASLISMPLQVGLCKHQVQTGRPLCEQV